MLENLYLGYVFLEVLSIWIGGILVPVSVRDKREAGQVHDAGSE